MRGLSSGKFAAFGSDDISPDGDAASAGVIRLSPTNFPASPRRRAMPCATALKSPALGGPKLELDPMNAAGDGAVAAVETRGIFPMKLPLGGYTAVCGEDDAGSSGAADLLYFCNSRGSGESGLRESPAGAEPQFPKSLFVGNIGGGKG